MHTKEEGDVFVHVDGDDRLLNKDALAYIRGVYADTNIWSTYGSYIAKSGTPCNCREVDLSEGIRPQILKKWPFSAPRTFRAFLWKYVTDNDLKDSQGNLLSAAVDAAIMSPILEVCGTKIFYIKKPLYYYNDDTGNNTHTVRLQDQVRCAYEVVYKEPKKPI